tara:strand:+ start:1942 stop:2481 length:540 start_codon:yes stop_codon:yes gene_type:complete
MSQIKVNSIVPAGGLPVGATGGGIIQIVKNKKTDVVSSTTINSFADLTGANVTITPSSNSNKIFGTFSIAYGMSTYHHIMNFRIVRGSSTVVSDVADGGSGGSTNFQSTTFGLRQMHDVNGGGYITITFDDAPATTSAVTYKLQYYAVQAGTYYLNRSGNDSSDYGRGACTFTAMEIGA